MYAAYGHIAFSLIAASLLIKDVFWLRVVSILASLSAMMYCFHSVDPSMGLILQWNAIFVLINLYRIGVLVQEKMGISFTEEEQELYETQFRNFSPTEFMKMLRAGVWRDVDAEEVLSREGKPVSYLMLIYYGRADVVANQHIVAEIKDGDFVGEMSFATEKPATATVVAKEPMRLLVWNKQKLKELLTRNPSIHFAMQSILSTNLVDKLTRQDGV